MTRKYSAQESRDQQTFALRVFVVMMFLLGIGAVIVYFVI